MTRRASITAFLILTVAASAVAVGVYASDTGGAPPEQAAAPHAVPVDFATMKTQPVRLWTEFSARLKAVDEVELRPQVSGAIVEIRFEDGERVQKDDVLFVIDPRPYRARVAEATAQLAAARVSHDHAAKDLRRARSLVRTSAISERVLDERSNAVAMSKSEIEAAEARLEQARIDLEHAFVKAPIPGRVSRAEITVGNLVQAGAGAPVLTSIVSDTQIYADFEIDAQTYFRFVHAGVRNSAAERDTPVKLRIGGETAAKVPGLEVDGHIHSFDNRIDPATDTIRARALFANDSGALLPGMFARVELGAPATRNMLLLTGRAILTDQDRKFVYVIDADGKAAYRQVTVGAAIGGERVVTSGLSAGDRVVTSNLMAIRPNAAVAPKSGQANAAAGGVPATR